MAQMYKRISRNEMIFRRLQHSEPREIYGQLLTIAKYREHKPGWVGYKFRAIFGKWPRAFFHEWKAEGLVEMIPPDSDLLSWIKAESRKYGLHKGREEAKLERAKGQNNGRQSETASLPTETK